jgi:hypothetical protein
MSTAECYNPVRNVWVRVSPPHYSRMAAACAVYNNRIYVAGGFGFETVTDRNGDGRCVLDTVEYYDYKTKRYRITLYHSPI